MKKFLALAFLLTGCATTGATEGDDPKYAISECLKLNEEAASRIPPQFRQMLELTNLQVVDVGTIYYVVEQSMMGQLQARTPLPFAQVEKDTNAVPCPRPRNPDEVEAKTKK